MININNLNRIGGSFTVDIKITSVGNFQFVFIGILKAILIVF